MSSGYEDYQSYALLEDFTGYENGFYYSDTLPVGNSCNILDDTDRGCIDNGWISIDGNTDRVKWIITLFVDSYIIAKAYSTLNTRISKTYQQHSPIPIVYYDFYNEKYYILINRKFPYQQNATIGIQNTGVNDFDIISYIYVRRATPVRIFTP